MTASIYREYFFNACDVMPGQGTGATNCNSANAYRGIVFTPPWTKTLNEVKIFNSTVTGTPTSAMRISVFEVTSRFSSTPAITSLQSVTATPTAGTNNVTGFTTSLTKNKLYFIAADNVHATPGSNYFSPFTHTGAQTPYHWTAISSNGTTMSNGGQNPVAMRLKFSDSTYVGTTVTAAAAPDTSSFGIYGTREAGWMFKAPCAMSVVGVGFISPTQLVTGTPTGNFRFKLYTGDGTKSLEATSDDMYYPTGSAIGTKVYFSSAVAIAKDEYVNIIACESTQSDTSSNRYNLISWYWENDADSKAMVPFDGKFVYYDGSSWTSDQTKILPSWGVFLENGNEFPVASGGGIILPRSVNGV